MENKKRYGPVFKGSCANLTLRFFPQLKSELHGKWFSDMDELSTESHLKKAWFGDIYRKWVQRHRKCVQHQGEYFEKLCR